MSPSNQPCIEVCENGRNVPAASHMPVLSLVLGEDVIVEKHLTPRSAQYGEREQATLTLFMHDEEPVRATWCLEGKRFNAWVCSGRVWIVPPAIPHKSSFQGPHGGSIALDWKIPTRAVMSVRSCV